MNKEIQRETTFRISDPELIPSEKEGVWPRWRFCIHLAGKQHFAVDVSLRKTDADVLLEDLDETDESKAKARIEVAVQKFGIRDIEQRIKEGDYPEEPTLDIQGIRIAENDLGKLGELLYLKTCTYQMEVGRDQYCSAASEKDPTASGKHNLRTLAPTSTPVCLACNLPDDHIICSHLVHPRVTGRQTLGDSSPRRHLLSAMCELGREEINDGAMGCAPGLYGCWERLVRIEPILAVSRVSPLSLHEALDFPGAVWGNAFPDHKLLRLRSASGLGRLVEECRSRSEFEGKLSTMMDVIRGLEITDDLLPADAAPQARDSSLNRLQACLNSRLDPVASGRVEKAITILRNVGRIRVGAQHSGAAAEAAAAYVRLGIPFPPSDWSEAWNQVLALVVEALRIIRAEIQPLVS